MNTTTTNSKKKILFANFPADGHFNPMTGLAVHLQSLGYEVRWYSTKAYAAKISKLNIQHYPFKKAIDVSEGNFDEIFPGRTGCKTNISKLKFDIIHAFVLRGPEYFEDIKEIYREFSFDLLIADCAFTGIPFVKHLLQVPVIALGNFPLTESSKDLAPNGLGIEPSYSFFGKMKQSVLRTIANQVIFKKTSKVLHQVLDNYNIPHHQETVFDMLVKKSDLLLQSGTPGFEYFRSDLSKNTRFVGPLLPFTTASSQKQWFDSRLDEYNKIILVTQGTVEKDIEKLLVPTLEAFRNTDTLVICTTGGSQTQLLKDRFPQQNIIIEDFIPFNDVMPYAGVYITNGGYGGVLLSIQNRLPLVVAGVHEGKNEICARVGFFKLGINLKTEKPTAAQVKQAVENVLADDQYSLQVTKLAKEFSAYDANGLCTRYVQALLAANKNNTVAVRNLNENILQ